MDSLDLDSSEARCHGAATAEAFPAPSISPHSIEQYPDHIPPLLDAQVIAKRRRRRACED